MKIIFIYNDIEGNIDIYIKKFDRKVFNIFKI